MIRIRRIHAQGVFDAPSRQCSERDLTCSIQFLGSNIQFIRQLDLSSTHDKSLMVFPFSVEQRAVLPPAPAASELRYLPPSA